MMFKIKQYCLLLLLILTATGNAQVRMFNFQIFDLPSADIGTFIIMNNLKNTQNIFQVTIEPAGNPVMLEGQAEWRDVNASSFVEVYHFKTRPFKSRNFFNTDIGNTEVTLSENPVNDEIIKELMKRGKPVGDFRFTVRLLTAEGTPYPNIVNEITRTLSFTNPAQTISILSPEANSTQDITNVLAQWSPVVGASEYLVKVGVRNNKSQSLEEALNSGTPLVNNKNVGNVTSVNLRQILEREWSQDQEIVFQVTAVIAGTSGGNKLYSNVVNFNFNNSNSFLSTNSVSSRNKFRTQEFIEALSKIKSQLLNGLNFNGSDILQIFDGFGRELTPNEVNRILKYLENNPQKIIDAKQGAEK